MAQKKAVKKRTTKRRTRLSGLPEEHAASLQATFMSVRERATDAIQVAKKFDKNRNAGLQQRPGACREAVELLYSAFSNFGRGGENNKWAGRVLAEQAAPEREKARKALRAAADVVEKVCLLK